VIRSGSYAIEVLTREPAHCDGDCRVIEVDEEEEKMWDEEKRGGVPTRGEGGHLNSARWITQPTSRQSSSTRGASHGYVAEAVKIGRIGRHFSQSGMELPVWMLHK
jgi:hypothetical protein